MTDLIPAGLSDGPPEAAPGSGLPCRYCGSTPSVFTVFKKHTGMVLLRRTDTIAGPFCRSCGTAWFRAATAHTMAVGWLGVQSFFIFPFVIGRNIRARRKIMKLGRPLPPPGGHPLNPGRPLLLRVQAALILVPVVFIALIVARVRDDQPQNQVGKCVSLSMALSGLSDLTNAYYVDCGSPHDAVVTDAVDEESQCPADGIGTLARKSDGRDLNDGKVLCLGRP
jgi:hypothetical protein